MSRFCPVWYLDSPTGPLRFLRSLGRSLEDKKSLHGGTAANIAFVQATISEKGASMASWFSRSLDGVQTCCQLIAPNAIFIGNGTLEMRLLSLLLVQSLTIQ
jgi:hypothetical protein